MSDAFNVAETVLSAPVNNALKLASWLLGTPEPIQLSITVVPRDALGCVDNHKGRFCQELLIGDVSLDFSSSGKGGVAFPDTVPETTILVIPGESVEFVLHNNGNCGSTYVAQPKADLQGQLTRTFKERAIGPSPNGQGLQTSTDPLFGGTPTSGAFQGPFPPIGNPNISPPPGGLGSVEVTHFSINSAVAFSQPARYRYFPDVSLSYKAPAPANAGDEDRYTFTVDGCSVAVTFLMVTDDGGGVDPPDEDIIETPVDGASGAHTVGQSPCPQTLAEIPVSNPSDQTVTVSADTTAGLIVSPPGLILEPGGSGNFTLEFDCSTQTSFNGSLTLSASSSGGDSKTLSIPVSMTISQP
jgi:hypothetical protein